MARLYSYCLPVDDGAAPNPFWGTCTLVICKPAIRRTARVGDWIAGTGAINAYLDRRRMTDLSGKLVYAMKVTRKMTMEEYDRHAQTTLPEKVPARGHRDRRRRLGTHLGFMAIR
jgi:Nucleotide modification associated domain 2